jgi:hypothetical protein
VQEKTHEKQKKDEKIKGKNEKQSCARHTAICGA